MTEHEELSIKRLKEFEPPEGYYLAFSGGKDSVVLKDLAIKAGVKFDAHYSVTTIDPPELVRFIKKYHSDVIWERPEKAFLTRLTEIGFPRRQGRWCCEEYKESGGSGRIVLTGIRAAESVKRGKRRMVENCTFDASKRYLHPIIDWTELNVWSYIRNNNIPYCELYDEGYKRIGCLFCPNAYYKHRQAQVRRYPRYAEAFRKAFRKLHATDRDSIKRWKDGDEMFDWWISSGLDESKQQFMHFDSDE
jgi:phosphoadenosine phosphosulfate reductase